VSEPENGYTGNRKSVFSASHSPHAREEIVSFTPPADRASKGG